MTDKKVAEKMPLIAAIFILLAVSYAGFFLMQMWAEVFDHEFFIKLSITYAVIGALLAAVYLIRREFMTEKEMKKNNYLD